MEEIIICYKQIIEAVRGSNLFLSAVNRRGESGQDREEVWYVSDTVSDIVCMLASLCQTFFIC